MCPHRENVATSMSDQQKNKDREAVKATKGKRAQLETTHIFDICVFECSITGDDHKFYFRV